MDAEELTRRREERARARRRRRTRRRAGIGATLGVVVIAVAVALASASGSGGAARTPASTSAPPTTAAHAPARSRRRASRHARGSTAAVLGPATGVAGTASVPVLMYHVIAVPPGGAPFPGLYVQPQEFAAQMQALKAAGWHAVTLDQLQAYRTKGARLPAGRPIVITFDNGGHSQYTEALPVLRRLGWVAE